MRLGNGDVCLENRDTLADLQRVRASGRSYTRWKGNGVSYTLMQSACRTKQVQKSERAGNSAESATKEACGRFSIDALESLQNRTRARA